MKHKVLILGLLLSKIVLSQNSQVDIDGNSKLELLEGSKICADEVTVQNGSTIWAYDYGQIKYSDCTVVLTPTGNGTVTLPVEFSDAISLPSQFTIDTAYPNPFNPTTHIKYGISEESGVKIVLYNIQGHMIRELYNGHQEAGWYTTTWDGLLQSGEIAPAGIYLMKIINTTNSKTEFKSIKISLIK